MSDTTELHKNARLDLKDYEAMAVKYEKGATIRELMKVYHLSYGGTRNALLNQGVTMRARGTGARRRVLAGGN
jgi:hypothetical protein